VAGGAVYGAWGTSVDYTGVATNWGSPTASAFTPVRLAGGANDFEAYLCLKCHSSNTTVPAGQSNIAQEFNPSNASYHNVFGQATSMQSTFTVLPSSGPTTTVTWALPTRSFFKDATLNMNSKMTCTDCHTNGQSAATQASGPHGSTVQWLLDPGYPTDWKTSYLTNGSTLGMNSTTTICAKCHDLNGPGVTNAWTNNVHNTGEHQGSLSKGGCVLCHVSVPHGWKRPRLLVNVTADTASGYSGSSSGTQRFAYKDYAINNNMVNWGQSSCQTNCGGHENTPNPYWP
jgi:hypothetical protein